MIPDAAPAFTARFSPRQNSWYVADQTGECVSSLYDTADEAETEAKAMRDEAWHDMPPAIPAGLPNGLGLMLWPLDWPRPLELESGHDVLCTARYHEDEGCHELNGCAVIDDWPATPPCTCYYAGSGFYINPACLHHGDGFRW